MTKQEEMVEFTSTWTPATQADCVERMTELLTTYVRRKWYEPRGYLLKDAIYWP